MITFIYVKKPLRPLKDFKPVRKAFGISISDYLTELGIEKSNLTVLVDNKKTLSEDWDSVLPNKSNVIISPAIGSSAVFILVAVIAVAIALYFFLPSMSPPSDQESESDSAKTLRGQKNQKKLGASIEKHYGRVRIWPSYMASPFTQFEGNDQYLYALFCLGLGKYNVHNIKIGETLIGNFDEVQYAIYQPDEKVTLFPTYVYTSSDVSGIELFGSNEDDYPSGGGWVGPFISAPPGAKSYTMQIDLSCRQGLYRLDSKGKIKFARVQALFQYRPIDDDDNPIGSGTWTNLLPGGSSFTLDILRNQTDSQRITVSIAVANARFEVRGRRANERKLDQKYRDAIHWEGMRTFNETEQNFGDVTLLAVKARATNNLNDSSKSDFNVELESILPVYNFSTGTFSNETTGNPVWAFVDIARAKYGKALGKDFLDLVRLSQLASDFDAAGIRFDGSFDSRVTVWSALQTVMNVARAVPVVIGGKISAIRDVPGVVPTLGFNANNIVTGSMSVTTKIVNHSEHDGLEIEYVDSSDWKRKTVSCLIGNDRGVRMKQIKLTGCTNRDKAYQWGMYQRSVEIYQSDNFNFETGIEGATAVFGDLIAIKHETLPSENDFIETYSDRLSPTALTYEIILGDSVSVIELPFSPVFEIDETYRIALRDNLGIVRGPYICTEHATNPFKVVLGIALDHSDFTVEVGAEASIFWFGVSGDEYTLARIIKIEPAGINVRISAVPYDERIYAFDSSTAPSISNQFQIPVAPPLPTVIGLTVTTFPDSLDEAVVSWIPSYGAKYYNVFQSLDGINFSFVASVPYSSLILSVEPGDLWLRVQAVNVGGGPFATWTGEVGIPTLPPDVPQNIRLLELFEGLNLSITFDPENLATSYIVKVYIGATEIVSKTVLVESATFSNSQVAAAAIAISETLVRNLNVTVQAVNAIAPSAESPPATFSNPQHVEPTDLSAAIDTGTDYLLEWECAEEIDFLTYKVYASLTSGFTPSGANLVGTTTSKSLIVDGSTLPLFVRVGALDAWGDDPALSNEYEIV